MSILSESYKKRLMQLSGLIGDTLLSESSRADFLKQDFQDRVGRKYDKFLKFFNRGIWDKERESDKFIKNTVSETIFKNGKIAPRDMWVAFMMKQFFKIESVDPTENKEYLNWLINIYLSGNLKDEDIYKANGYITLFNRNKERLPIEQRNINSYIDLSSLYNVVSIFEKGEEISTSEKQKIIKLEGAKQVYDSENWKVIIPKTEEAACLYGKNTKWCTASKDDNNQFKRHNEQGPLYILINKKISNDRDVMKKLQFHFESNQFMDTTDKSVNVTNFFKTYPELQILFEKLGKIDTGFKIDYKLVTKEEGLKLLKTTKDKLSFLDRKGFKFFHDFYIEMGAGEEFKNIILNDNEFIKDIFYKQKFNELLQSYISLSLKEQGLQVLMNSDWLNKWIFNANPQTIQHFIINLTKMGPKAKQFALELLKKGGVIWNALLQPGKVKISQYFNMISHSETFGKKGVKMVIEMLKDKGTIKELNDKGVSNNTIKHLMEFFGKIPTKLEEYGVTSLHEFNNEARLYLKNILN